MQSVPTKVADPEKFAIGSSNRRSIFSPLTNGDYALLESRRRQSILEYQHDWSVEIEKKVDESHQLFISNLDHFYRKVKSEIMAYQSLRGLFPSYQEPEPNASLVRDNIFCAAAVWSLRQCYIHIDDDGGRTYELGQCAVKCMRAILFCWMKQSEKVEKFKLDQSPEYALHSKFSIDGNEIVSHKEYGHLQIYNISLYLIFLAQMITSGLQIIYSADEVAFIQQLVFYVERAYRTADYGFWGRGSKYNNFQCEMNSSSIGAAKAALEILNGFSLYGDALSSPRSVIYVDIDAYNRNRSTFDTLLPRESASKNTDAALLFTISWPVFAVHNEELVNKTMYKCKRKLQGQYGFKRYLRDGQYTVLEDKTRPLYRADEVKNFDGIECQWPLFYAQMVIDACFRENEETREEYMRKLQPLLQYQENGDMMPMYFYVDRDQIDTARNDPDSCCFMCCNELEESVGTAPRVFLFGQAIWIIAQLLAEKLLRPNDLDPVMRHERPSNRPARFSRYSSIHGMYPDLVVQVIAIAESARLQQLLLTYGIITQTPKQIEPIRIWPPSELVRAYGHLGVNEKFEFTGRPPRPIGVLGTSKIYRICSQMVICYPLTFETVEFYISHDLSLLLDNVREDFEFLKRGWKLKGRPVYLLLIKEAHVKSQQKTEILSLLDAVKTGEVNGVRVRLSRLQTVVSSAVIEHLDFLSIPDSHFVASAIEELKLDEWYYKSLTEISYKEPNQKYSGADQPRLEDYSTLNHDQLEEKLCSLRSNTDDDSGDMFQRCQILNEFARRHGLEHVVQGSDTTRKSVKEYTEHMLDMASETHNWALMRYCSATLRLFVNSLAPSITNIIARGKIVSFHKKGCENDEIEISKPIQPQEIYNIIYDQCSSSDPFFAVIVQEMILCISNFMSTEPLIFEGILKLRFECIFEAMKYELDPFSRDVNEQVNIYSLSPNELKQLVYYVFTCNNTFPERDCVTRRRLDGLLNRSPLSFYDHAWAILERTYGVRIAGTLLPSQPTLSDMTNYELNFSLMVERMLSNLKNPVYRQLNVELVQLIYVILFRNNEIKAEKVIDLDEMIELAVSLFEKDTGKPGTIDEFVKRPPTLRRGGTTNFLVRAATDHLLKHQLTNIDNERKRSSDLCTGFKTDLSSSDCVIS